MSKQGSDFYQRLRISIRDWLATEEGSSNKWSEYLLLAPDFFHLLCKLSIDRDVPTKEKAKLAVAIAYFVSPLDLLPVAFHLPPSAAGRLQAAIKRLSDKGRGDGLMKAIAIAEKTLKDMEEMKNV